MHSGLNTLETGNLIMTQFDMLQGENWLWEHFV